MKKWQFIVKITGFYCLIVFLFSCNTSPPANTDNSEKAEYVPSEKEYNEAFKDIETTINRLNEVILKKDYNSWITFLTDEFKDYYGDSANLKKISESPTLKAKSIVLRNLKDYFIHVIVPSRIKTKLESIAFVDNNHVKAYGKIYNENAILYYLEKNKDKWKIAIW
ncbi:MAG: hypothetical protein JW969_04090 [Spirochaetales bacterium]|nr:hypothetical protein [Spirochaetales bacterium]